MKLPRSVWWSAWMIKSPWSGPRPVAGPFWSDGPSIEEYLQKMLRLTEISSNIFQLSLSFSFIFIFSFEHSSDQLFGYPQPSVEGEQIEACIEEERSERLRAEGERLTSLQKRLQAHEVWRCVGVFWRFLREKDKWLRKNDTWIWWDHSCKCSWIL